MEANTNGVMDQDTEIVANAYDNSLGLQDLPRSKSDAHIDPTKESVQMTKET